MSNLEDYFQDCVHIRGLAAELGYTITLGMACAIWEKHSEDYCAGWLMLDDDKSIKNVIEYHMDKGIKLCPHCGKRLDKKEQ